MTESTAENSSPIKPWEYITSGIIPLFIAGPLGIPLGIGSLYLWSKVSRKHRWVIWGIAGVVATPIAWGVQVAVLTPFVDEPSKPVEVSVPNTPESVPETDYLAAGKTRGYTAAEAAQTASTPEQWGAVSEIWQKAIDQLEQVPVDHPDYEAAEAKISEYRSNKLTALRNKSDLEVERNPDLRLSDLDRFKKKMREVDPDAAIVSGSEMLTDESDTLKVTVTTSFLMQNKEVQREAAAGLQKIWAGIHSPTDPDKASIYLVTGSGQHIGGSRMWGGTMVYIKD